MAVNFYPQYDYGIVIVDPVIAVNARNYYIQLDPSRLTWNYEHMYINSDNKAIFKFEFVNQDLLTEFKLKFLYSSPLPH